LAFSTEASFGEYASESVGAVATGPVDALNSSWRVAVQRFRSDGYRRDAFLHRDDTDGRDELTGRAKWRWRPSEETTVDLTWLHAKLDNGYDGWSIDNSRVSLADRPGKDAQTSDGASLRVETNAGSLGRLTVIAAGSDSDSEYSFDEDWGNERDWAPFTYDFFYGSQRNRTTRSLEARLASPDAAAPGAVAWLAGIYALDVGETLERRPTGRVHRSVHAGVFRHDGLSPAQPLRRAQRRRLRPVGRIVQRALGLVVRAARREPRGGLPGQRRAQRRAACYRRRRDRHDVGWQATVYFDPREQLRTFVTLSRGYKAGGFNLGQAATIRPRFEPEYLWSIDVGAKGEWLERRLYADVTAFYMKREDMQISTGVQLDPIGDPGSYFFLTDNASGGRNLGLESSVRWRFSGQLEVGGTLGLLRTRYSGYRPAGEDLSDRDQAHAPEYQLSLNATWRHPLGWMARVDVSAVDDFYFDVPPNPTRSAAYWLTHLKSATKRSAGACTRGAATCSTTITLCEGSISATSRRCSRTSATCSSASRGSWDHLPDGSFDAYRSRDQPVSARRRLHSADQGVHRSSEHLSGAAGHDQCDEHADRGEHARVFEILGKETAITFGERGRKVFVMKVLGGA
jgi:hypothetical protein